MNVEQTIIGLRQAVAAARKAGRTIGLVPTMGALHAGHLSLMDAARAAGEFVVVSIFVNPIQFGPSEDLDRYPRTPQADLDACRSRGVGAVFMPTAEQMYPQGRPLTAVTVGELGDHLCGASRPGHFAGVCTVVAKLFHIVGPDRAYFGAKDFQQAAILRRMAADLDFPLEIVICPTVREADGLAMSSRNRNLSPEHRRQAPALNAALHAAAELIRRGRCRSDEVVAAVRQHLAREAPAGEIDYVEVVRPDRLGPVKWADRPVLVALAVRFGGVRLIDNVLVE